MTRAVVTADEFLTSPALERPKEDVPVPELGEGKVVSIWGMTPRERTIWEDKPASLTASQLRKYRRSVRERLLVECCRYDDGTPMFTLSQIEQLGQRRADVCERLVNVALRLSGFTSTDIETLAKNSGDATED